MPDSTSHVLPPPPHCSDDLFLPLPRHYNMALRNISDVLEANGRSLQVYNLPILRAELLDMQRRLFRAELSYDADALQGDIDEINLGNMYVNMPFGG